MKLFGNVSLSWCYLDLRMSQDWNDWAMSSVSTFSLCAGQMKSWKRGGSVKYDNKGTPGRVSPGRTRRGRLITEHCWIDCSSERGGSAPLCLFLSDLSSSCPFYTPTALPMLCCCKGSAFLWLSGFSSWPLHSYFWYFCLFLPHFLVVSLPNWYLLQMAN